MHVCIETETQFSLHRQLLKFIWYLESFFWVGGGGTRVTVLFYTPLLYCLEKKHAFTLSCFWLYLQFPLGLVALVLKWNLLQKISYGVLLLSCFNHVQPFATP